MALFLGKVVSHYRRFGRIVFYLLEEYSYRGKCSDDDY
jgi:hypothetical protein